MSKEDRMKAKAEARAEALRSQNPDKLIEVVSHPTWKYVIAVVDAEKNVLSYCA
jgi:hypothetical protein